MPSDYTIRSVPDPGEEICEVVNGLLRAHNRQANPAFWEAYEREENQPDPIVLIAFDDADAVIGGLFGATQFSWLKVEVMAVSEAIQGQGIGQALLEEAESIACQRGCQYVYVDTMSYQAPEFYMKAGYTVVGELADWDSMGHTKYFLTKSL